MSNTKEQVLEAAKSKFAKKEFFIDDEKKISVTLHELSRQKRDELNKRLYVCDKEGMPVSVDKDGKLDPDGDEWKYQEGSMPMDEWLSETMEPKFSVEELKGPEWPISLKIKILKEAQEVNGLTIKDAAGN